MTIAWYDPTNHHVSTDKNDPLFTPLGQLWPLDDAEEHKRTIAKLQLEIKNLNSECVEIYGLLALAHLNIRQHLKYGFSPLTAQSTLISVGQYSPKLKAEMEKTKEKNV
jgi:hypothetical protein